VSAPFLFFTAVIAESAPFQIARRVEAERGAARRAEAIRLLRRRADVVRAAAARLHAAAM
jgi:hypothetical protein